MHCQKDAWSYGRYKKIDKAVCLDSMVIVMRYYEKIAKLIYYNIIPFIVGFYVFSHISPEGAKGLADLIQKTIIFLSFIIPFAIIYNWIGSVIFPRLFPENILVHRLATKMTNCNIRKEKGRDYCAECADGYECASSIDKID